MSTVSSDHKTMQRLGELLISQGVLAPDHVQKALEMQHRAGGNLGTNLLELSLIDESVLLKVLGRQRSTPTVSAEELRSIPERILNLIPPELAKRYRIVPFRLQGNTVYVASKQPGDLTMENEISFVTSRMTRTFIGLELRIQEALEHYYSVPPPVRSSFVLRRLNGIDHIVPGPLLGPTGNVASSPQPQGDAIEDNVLLETTGRPIRWEDWRRYSRRDRTSILQDEPPPKLESTVIESPDSSEFPLLDTIFATEIRANRTEQALEHAHSREQIARALLEGSREHFRRRLVFAVRGDRVVGWRGDGEKIVPLRIQSLNFDYHESPLFLTLRTGAPFWLGPLVASPVHDRLVEALGGIQPSGCLVLPVVLRDKPVAFLYGDNLDHGVAGTPVGQLQELTRHAAEAFERYLSERKKSRPKED